MISKKRIFKYSTIALGIISIPAIATAGFFVVGNADRFRKFSVSPQNDSTNALVTAYRAAVFAGAKVIMAPGFTHNVPIATAVESEPKLFGDTGFLLFDDVVPADSKAAMQTFNITYRADLGSIQTGVAAAYFLNANQDAFITSSSPGLTYSVWGGLPFSSVTSFMGGLQKGINWANENLVGKEIDQADGTKKTYVEVTQIFGDSDFTGGFGPSDGIGIQQSIINKRADLIMPVAGPQIFNAQQLILTSNSPSLLLGVDSAVEEDPRNSPSRLLPDVGNKKIVQFSSLKNLRVSGEIALELVNNGNRVPEGEDPNSPKYNGFLVQNPDKTEPEMVGGLGISAVGNIVNGSVGVSDEGKQYSNAAMALLPSNVVAPWLDPFYSIHSNMFYEGIGGQIENYGNPPFGLRQEPTINIPETAKYSDVLDLKNFITPGDESSSDRIKIILSSALSILLDASFSQSCYLALADFMTRNDVSVPYPNGFFPPQSEV